MCWFKSIWYCGMCICTIFRIGKDSSEVTWHFFCQLQMQANQKEMTFGCSIKSGTWSMREKKTKYCLILSVREKEKQFCFGSAVFTTVKKTWLASRKTETEKETDREKPVTRENTRPVIREETPTYRLKSTTSVLLKYCCLIWGCK